MHKFVFTYGFALFAMFFGAGNLVFPLQIGLNVGEHWILGALGLAATGIILPFLGLFVIKLYRGDYLSFFEGAGAATRFGLPFVLLSLLGMLGVPRCVTVAYGGICGVVSDVSLESFSALFCIAAYCCCLTKQKWIEILGKWLAPLLLFFILVLIVLCARRQGVLTETEGSAASSLLYGVTSGYQTMDVISGLFFSSMMFLRIQKILPQGATDKDVIKVSVKSSGLACALLGIVYFGMVFMGATFADLIKDVNPAMMFSVIAERLLGNRAALLIGMTIMFACFKTVLALNDVYARYLHTLFKLKEDKLKFVFLGTTATSFVISLFDFSGITKFLVPVLGVLYPGVIVLIIASLFSQKPSLLKKILFYGTLVIALGQKIRVF